MGILLLLAEWWCCCFLLSSSKHFPRNFLCSATIEKHPVKEITTKTTTTAAVTSITKKIAVESFIYIFSFVFTSKRNFEAYFVSKSLHISRFVLPSFHSSTIKLSNHLMLQKLKEETVEIAIFNLRQPQMLSQVIAKKLSYRPHLQ